MEQPRVVVIGAGFGGLTVVKTLRKAPCEIVIVDRRNYHLFQPLLYQVATAGLNPADIAYPVRKIVRNYRNVSFKMCEARHIDLERKTLITDHCTLPYDYLVIATGSRTNWFDSSDLPEHAFDMKDLPDAVRIRDHVLRRFEEATLSSDSHERRALLTFTVVGGGPTGVETAGALAELIRLVLAEDYPDLDLAEVRILLLEGSNRLLSAMSEELRQRAEELLWRKRVEIVYGSRVTSFDGATLSLDNGETIRTHTVIWAAGVRGEALPQGDNLPTSASNRIIVDDQLRLPDHPEVFVIGDAAHVGGPDRPPLPMVAPVAIQQGEAVAGNILADLRKARPSTFRYRDRGKLATIGRNAAVAEFGNLHFSGILAWFLWLVVHLVQLIGFRNRLIVLLNWVWDYLFYDRAIRLIIDYANRHESESDP